MFRTWTIRRLLFALVFAIVLPTAVLLTYSLQSTVRGNLSEASAITLSLAQITAADTQRMVRDSGFILADLARRPKVRSLDPDNCDAILRDFREFFPQFANLAITDKAGRVVCSAIPIPAGKSASVAGAAWLKQVALANHFVAGHPHIGPVSGKWVAVLAYPIQDDEGKFNGAIGLPVDLVNFQPLPSMSNLPAGTVIRIVDADGTIIATSDEPKKWVGKRLPDQEMLNRMLTETQGTAWQNYKTGSQAYGFTPVADTGWMVVCSIPSAMIFDNVLVKALKSGGLLFLLTLLGAAMAYCLGRRIVLPIIGIAGTAREVAAGDFSRRAALAGPREIEDVARQFNNMLDVRARTEDKYRNLLESATDAIVIVDGSHNIILANARTEQMFGFQCMEMIGQSIAMLVPQGARARHAELVDAYSTSEHIRQKRHNVEVIGLRKDGSEFPIEVTLSPLQTEEGLIVSAIIRDLSERKRYEERLVYLARYDGLTGLPNRNLLLDRLSQAMARADQDGSKVAVILLDIDRFKEINDTLGHKTGNQVLKGLAERLVATLDPLLTIAHLGGDEFIIMMEMAGGESEIQLLAEKIQLMWNAPLLIDQGEIFLLVSLGISIYPDDSKDSEALLKNADVAMHHAKRDGRNTYRFYAQQMDARATERLKLEHGLRRALPNNELLLHYQPQIDTHSGRMRGVEALVRWNSPELGMVAPNDFIGVAEEIGLIGIMGEWILRTACSQNKAWQDMGLMPLVMAVNISARQFSQKNLAQTVQAVLRETGLDPVWLELEVTESMLMQDPQAAEQTLREIAAMGVGIALDDFGTGYSSLAYLKRFPVGILKIDRSFVRDLHTDPDDAAIVTAVVSLAKSLKMGLVAEGVEQQEQLDFLQSLNCDSCQGFFFSKPLPAERCMALLQAQTKTI